MKLTIEISITETGGVLRIETASFLFETEHESLDEAKQSLVNFFYEVDGITATEPNTEDEDQEEEVEEAAASSEPDLIEIQDVIRLTGLKKSTIYNKTAAGKFPKQASRGFWDKNEVLKYIKGA